MTTGTDQPPQLEIERLVKRFYAEAYNHGEYEVLEELFAPEYGGIGNAAFEPRPSGPELAQLGVDQLREAFPDLDIDVRGVYVDGDTVVSHLTVTGTHDGPLVLGPDDDPFVAEPTGTSFEMGGVRIFHFEDGLVAESYAYADELDLAVELGFACDFAEYVTSQGDQD